MHVRFGKMTINTEAIVREEETHIGQGASAERSGTYLHMNDGSSVHLSVERANHLDSVRGTGLNDTYTGA